jgi:hypothetical protein
MLTGNLKTTRCSEGCMTRVILKMIVLGTREFKKIAKNESLTIYIPHGCVRGGA